MTVIIRKAERKDCGAIMELKKELALHSKMSHLPFNVSVQDLERDGFDSDPPFFQCLVAEVEKVIIGYVLYYINYPLWVGAGLVLEDICVSASQRGKNIGSLLMKELAKIAVEKNYSRITLEVKNWNQTAINFYTKHFGVDYTKEEGWHMWKLDKDAINNLAK